MAGKSFIVTLKENAPADEINKLKHSISELDGSVTHEFSLIKGFTVKLPDEFNFKRLHDTHGSIISNIEEDKQVHTN